MSDFQSLFKRSKAQPKTQMQSHQAGIAILVKDQFQLETLLLIGAVIQTALVFTLPWKLAISPAVLALLLKLITTSLQAGNYIKYENEQGTIHEKFSAQLPVSKDGSFGNQPAAESVVVFMLGVHFNHPLGLFAPGVKEIGDHAAAMNKDMTERAKEYGLLGASSWRGMQYASNNQILSVYYFRDMEGLRKFAHDPIHREGWDWYYKSPHQKHLGIFHEAFSVPKRSWETIYANTRPSMMSATMFPTVDDKGEEGWVKPVVPAKGSLRSQFGRMAKSAGDDLETYGQNF